MSEFQRALAMTPMQYAWCFDKLLQGGYERPAVERFLTEGVPLPLMDAELQDLKCKSCGKLPYRTPEGRIMLGCNGNCGQRMFADLRDDAVQARAQRVAAAAGNVSEKSVGFSDKPRQRGLWREDE